MRERRGEWKMTSNRKLWLLSAALCLSAGPLFAQEPGLEEMGPPGPMGGRMEILGFGEMHSGKVVTGAPYSGVAVMETRQTLQDGNVIDRKTQANVYRDGLGRTRREMALSAVGPLAASGQPKSFVMIHDPVASTAFVLHPDKKVAMQLPEHGGGHHHDAMEGRFAAHMQREIADGTLKTEDLGMQTINGLSAQGTRYTKTIPAGQIGNAKAITITSERWYSADLQVVVKSTHNDPLRGDSSYTLTKIQRQEPSAALFTVPADYTVKQGPVHAPGGKHDGINYAPADTPPPPAN
jgi:hypothetical protein